MKKRLSFLSLSVSMALVGMLQSSSYAAVEDVKIATVDMQKALQSVEAGKKARAQLEKEFNAKKKDLQTEEASIKKMSDDFNKQALALSEEAKTKKRNELQERVIKFQELTARSQSEIELKQRELTLPIVNKLKGIIAEAAKKKSYTVVLEKNENSVLFSLEKDDLTSEVISSFDQQSKTAGKNPAET